MNFFIKISARDFAELEDAFFTIQQNILPGLNGLGISGFSEDNVSKSDTAYTVQASEKSEMDGLSAIINERFDQVQNKNYTPEHDARYDDSELKKVAVYCITLDAGSWPESWSSEIRFKIDQKSLIERMAIAGALCSAEIDRLTFINNG